MKVDWFKTVQFLFAGQFCLKVIWRFRMEPHETAKASNRNDGLKILMSLSVSLIQSPNNIVNLQLTWLARVYMPR